MNSVTIVGFVGSDPEQRQARNNGSKFTVLSVATQRSWKNAEDEWVSKVEWHRVAIFRPRLAGVVLNSIKKGAHVLVEGSLVSSTYEQANGKGKKAKTAKITSWSIRADVVRKLDRGEPEPQAAEYGLDAAVLSSDASDPAPFCPFSSKGPPTMVGGPFLLFCFSGSVRRFTRSRSPVT